MRSIIARPPVIRFQQWGTCLVIQWAVALSSLACARLPADCEKYSCSTTSEESLHFGSTPSRSRLGSACTLNLDACTVASSLSYLVNGQIRGFSTAGYLELRPIM